jgi:hypothetical protein
MSIDSTQSRRPVYPRSAHPYWDEGIRRPAGSQQRWNPKKEDPTLSTVSKEARESIARTALPWFLAAMVMLLILPVVAADKQKDEDTLQRANIVLQDILNDKNISPELLSKANCVLILPGVKKLGVGIGGNGGRGPLLCRSGQN